MKEVKIVEVFTSLQGEGSMMGTRQIFVRLAGCNLKCSYCDTDFSVKKTFPLETTPFSRNFEHPPNPVDSQKLLQLVLELREKSLTDWLVFTGGEPLIQADFLKSFLPLVKKEDLNVYLETNATLPENFKKVSEYVDFVSLDIKLSYLCQPDYALKKQPDFFQLCRGKRGEAKVVMVDLKSFLQKNQSPKKTLDELVSDFEQKIAKFSTVLPDYPLILQPATGFFQPDFEQMIEYQSLALKYHSKVKLLPRLHILYNLL